MTRLGEYELLDRVGKGGMGTVHRARGPLGREVAIKVLELGDPVAQARFEREAQAAARVRHTNLATVHEAGSADGRSYIVMDLIAGRSLREVLREGLPDPERAAAWVAAVARAVAAIHEAGLLHRDLKPANILLEDSGRVVLTDFGVALDLSAEQRLSLTGELLGTPCYMAPEQAEAKRAVDERTDVYGLGATLYHLLTGRPPFEGITIHVLAQVAEARPVDPRELRPGLDPELAAICLRALEKDPAARFTSATRLAEALDTWTAGAAAAHTPPPRWIALGLASLIALVALAAALVAAARRSPPAPQTVSAPTPQETPSAPGWTDLLDRLCREGPDLDPKTFDALLARLGQAPDAAALRAHKLAGLEASAETWQPHLQTSSPRALQRLVRLAKQTPRVWAGPRLSAALSAALAGRLKAIAWDKSAPPRALMSVARLEDQVFYELDPRPRWSLNLQHLLERLPFTPRTTPRIALSQVRYWVRERRFGQLGGWLEVVLQERPRSAIRAALGWRREAARATTPQEWLALLERLDPIVGGPELVYDLNPRLLMELLRPFLSRLQVLERLPAADRARAGSLLKKLSLECARRQVENPYLSLGSELPLAMELAAEGARLEAGSAAAIELLQQRGPALASRRLEIPVRTPGERLRYAARFDKEARVGRARAIHLIARLQRDAGQPRAAIETIASTTQDDRKLPGDVRAQCRSLHAQLLLDADRVEEAAPLVAQPDPRMLRHIGYLKAALEVARRLNDPERVRFLLDRAKPLIRPSAWRRLRRSAEPGEPDRKRADK